MKQNIDITDLNQLSEKGKERLRDWFYSADYPYGKAEHPFRYESTVGTVFMHYSTEDGYEGTIPLPNIGQMIEFLDEHGQYDLNGIEQVNAKDLCDFLWKAVKQILETKGNNND